jgi:hypothetical protein
VSRIAKCRPADFTTNWSKSMNWNESMIKLALNTVNLVILRWQVDEAMSNRPVDQQQLDRLTLARDLLAECNTTVVLQ